MTRIRTKALLAVGLVFAMAVESSAQSREKPAPPPSRYGYTLKIDADSLPKGVKVRELKDNRRTWSFITNPTDVPLVIDEIFHNNVLVSGKKLVSGKVYGYFPNGVPMEGKTHLKGWVAFGDMEETYIYLAKEPAKIYEGRQAAFRKRCRPPSPSRFPPITTASPTRLRRS